MTRLFIAIALMAKFMVVPALAATVHYPAQLEPGVMAWSQVGSRPCLDAEGYQRCDFGVALAEAAERGVIPRSVEAEAAALFEEAYAAIAAGEKPDWQTIPICQGWRGWMTFYNVSQHFLADTLATFARCEDAHGWEIADEATGQVYRIFRVEACGNYGGDRGPQLVQLSMTDIVVMGGVELPRSVVASSHSSAMTVGLPGRVAAAPQLGGFLGGGSLAVNDGDMIVTIIQEQPTCLICPQPEQPGAGNGLSPSNGVDNVIPLPAAGWLLLSGLAGLGLLARRRRQATT